MRRVISERFPKMAVHEQIIEVKGLTKHFAENQGIFDPIFGRKQVVHAVDDLNLEIFKGEILGLVGESGSGKTTVGAMIVRLLEPTSGIILFDGRGIQEIPRRDYSRKVQIIFQDPYSSLDPRMSINSIVREPLQIHTVPKEKHNDRIHKLLEQVQLSPDYLNRYPHELSGGERQRVSIATALALDPEFLVADEPVSALDVSIQAQIINLLTELRTQLDISMLFISHDLSVVEHICDRIVVMYLGQTMEVDETEGIFDNPLHPYTQALLSAIPQVDREKKRQEMILKGEIPSPVDPPLGCRFHTRCAFKIGAICEDKNPQLLQVSETKRVRCHLYDHDLR
jgi:oligopeptide transport system ATP-binding protein